MIKKYVCLIVSIIILLTSTVTVFADSKIDDNISNKRVVDVLTNSKIEFSVDSNGNIKLKNTNPNNVKLANNLIEAKFNTTNRSFLQTTSMKAGKYPTSWMSYKTYDRTINKKFQKATRTAIAAAVSAWLMDYTQSAKQLGKLAASAMGTYFFVESDQETIYVHIKNYYRELGPGKFDSMGNFIGDYELKKVQRINNSRKDSGGETLETTLRSSILMEIL